MDILLRWKNWGRGYAGSIVNGLCVTCRRIFKDSPEAFPAYERGRLYELCHPYELHDDYIEELERTSKAGCGICRLLLDTLDPNAKRSIPKGSWNIEPDTLDGERSLRSLMPEEQWNIRLKITSTEGGWMCQVTTRRCGTLISLVLQASADFEPTLFNKKIPATLGSYRSGAVTKESRDALPLGRWWLERCEECHGICNATRRACSSTPPTRLLCVSGDKVCLELGETFGPNPRYATLSHKWGTLRNLTLRSRNIERFRQGIAHGDLCKTFQDAICITKTLGLEYLWIDSLCIVQDDPQDWAREATIMCNIYGGSVLTIAAASAEDGSEGCFFKRDQNLNANYKFNGRGGKDLTLAKEGVYESCFEGSPLASRAWAFQERQLSPRILSMFSKQVCWECKEARACESYPDGIPNILEKKSGSDLRADELFKGELSKASTSSVRPGMRGNALPSWANIVWHYTSKKLTYGKDKLPALAGVARKYQEVMGFGEGEYVAGLWRKGLEEQLLWKADEEVWRPVFRAPSWSWANVDCSVWAYDPNLTKDSEYFISVIGVTGLPLGAAAFGEIESGVLEVGCESLVHVRESTYARGLWNRCFYHIPSPTLAQEEDPLRGWTLQLDLDVKNDGLEDHYILPIRSDRESALGLVLASTGQDKGVYRRLGTFRLLPLQHWQDIIVPAEAEDYVRVVEGEVKRKFVIHVI